MSLFNNDNEFKTTRMKRREKRLLAEKIGIMTKKISYIGIILLTLIIVGASYLHMTGDNFNILNSLKQQYDGKFTVVSSEETRRMITYEITDENGIKFNAYKTKIKHPTERKNDYKEQLIKKFALEYIKEHNIESIVINEEMAANLLNIGFNIEVDRYSEIDDAVNSLQNLKSFVTEAAKPYLNSNLTLKINLGKMKINDFEIDIPKFVGADTIVEKVKRAYISYIKEENITDEEITKMEIDKYVRPEKLMIIIDGNIAGSGEKKAYATYNERTDEYFIKFSDVIAYVPVVSNIIKDEENSVIKFNYKDVEYTIKDTLANFKQNDVYNEATVNYFKTFFNVKSTEYDYEEGFLYLYF